MNGKRIKIGIFTVTMALTFVGAAWSADRIHDRKRSYNHQINRIYSGVEKGRITPKEYRKLNKEQYQIHKAKQKMFSDGKITKNEKKRLAHLRQKANRHIYKATHNHQNCYHHKYTEHRNYPHKSNRYNDHAPRYKYDDYHRWPHHRHNTYSFAGTWIDPNWGFSFYANDMCRR